MDSQLLEELKNRRAKARAGGGEDKLQERRNNGLMTARDRLDTLLDAGSFSEIGQHVTHHSRHFGMDKKEAPCDGVITGTGTLDGRRIGVYSQDFTSVGGSLGIMHAQKIAGTLQQCMQLGIPFVGINDSGGARIQEGVQSLSGYAKVFNMNVQASGVIPQLTIISGPCAGGASYSPALCDFIIMTRQKSFMFICGPEVIKAATYQNVTMADVGDPDVHASVSGNAHFVVDTDEQAANIVRRLLSFLPSNNMMDPPHNLSAPLTSTPDPEFSTVIPDSSSVPYDVRKIVRRLVDNGDFLEIHEKFAPNILVGFARIDGVVVGLVANQPLVKAGTLDIDASDKASRFILFCNSFNIPLVTLVDTPGYLPGLQQERGGIIRHGAKVLYAYSATTVPKITLNMRKAYGGAYIAMCCQDLGADAVFAWPTAEIAVMGAEQAVRILYRREIDGKPDGQERAKELAKEYRDRFSSPYQAGSLGLLTDVIDPAETKMVISRALRIHLSKRVSVPPKKNGNMPV